LAKVPAFGDQSESLKLFDSVYRFSRPFSINPSGPIRVALKFEPLEKVKSPVPFAGFMLYALPSLPAAPLGKNARDASSKNVPILFLFYGFCTKYLMSFIKQDFDSNVPPSDTTRVWNSDAVIAHFPPPPITPLRSR